MVATEGTGVSAATSETVRTVAHGIGAFAVASVFAPLTYTFTRGW
jgi:hypothetical protein